VNKAAAITKAKAAQLADLEKQVPIKKKKSRADSGNGGVGVGGPMGERIRKNSGSGMNSYNNSSVPPQLFTHGGSTGMVNAVSNTAMANTDAGNISNASSTNSSVNSSINSSCSGNNNNLSNNTTASGVRRGRVNSGNNANVTSGGFNATASGGFALGGYTEEAAAINAKINVPKNNLVNKGPDQSYIHANGSTRTQIRAISPQYTAVEVNSENFKFSCGHFVAFKGFRERLHGHNYTMSVRK
jgi:hypothetical protein